MNIHTLTCILDGPMFHEDHFRMRGFQIWINLPAQEKMQVACYQDMQAEECPVINLSTGVKVKVIAGTAIIEDLSINGLILAIYDNKTGNLF